MRVGTTLNILPPKLSFRILSYLNIILIDSPYIEHNASPSIPPPILQLHVHPASTPSPYNMLTNKLPLSVLATPPLTRPLRLPRSSLSTTARLRTTAVDIEIQIRLENLFTPVSRIISPDLDLPDEFRAAELPFVLR